MSHTAPTTLKLPSAIRALPSGKEAKVARIATYDGDLPQAVAGQSITLKNPPIAPDDPGATDNTTLAPVTAEQIELAADKVNDIPDPSAPTVDEEKVEHEKINDYRYEKRVTTEVIDASGAALVGYKLTGDGQVATVESTPLPEVMAKRSVRAICTSAPFGHDRSNSGSGPPRNISPELPVPLTRTSALSLKSP